MSAIAEMFGVPRERDPLCDMFLRWQCQVRLIAMRQKQGAPDDAVTPALTLPGAGEPMGHVITILSKGLSASKVPELRHMVQRTNDPAQRREKALQYFAETYYQSPDEFSDVLTATFPPRSPGAETIAGAGRATLTFEAYSQRFDLVCDVARLAPNHPLHQATWWHNLLFNPNLHPDTVILGFKPDWGASSAEPELPNITRERANDV